MILTDNDIPWIAGFFVGKKGKKGVELPKEVRDRLFEIRAKVIELNARD